MAWPAGSICPWSWTLVASMLDGDPCTCGAPAGKVTVELTAESPETLWPTRAAQYLVRAVSPAIVTSTPWLPVSLKPVSARVVADGEPPWPLWVQKSSVEGAYTALTDVSCAAGFTTPSMSVLVAETLREAVVAANGTPAVKALSRLCTPVGLDAFDANTPKQ